MATHNRPDSVHHHSLNMNTMNNSTVFTYDNPIAAVWCFSLNRSGWYYDYYL